MTGGRYLPHDWFPRPLPGNVELGPRCWLYSSFAFLHYRSSKAVGLRVGHDSGLYHGTFFDLGPDGEMSVGDYCTIVGAVVASNGQVDIGDYAFISHEVVLADHFCPIPGRPGQEHPANRAHPAGPVGSGAPIRLAANVWVGARATLLAPVHIGEGSIIGAAAVVTGDVPPFSIVAGNPPRIVSAVRRTRSES